MGAAVALLATLGVGAATVALGYQMFNNIRPGKSRIQKEIARIREELISISANLVPLEKKELELLCSNLEKKSTKKRVAKTLKGLYSSIYHEPMVAFMYRKYMSRKENSLIIAKTANHEFIYRTTKNGTEVIIDNQLIGAIKSDWILYPIKSRKGIAQLFKDGQDSIMPVYIGNKEVASIYKENLTEPQPNPRAFEFIKDMPKQQELVFLSLALLELIQRNQLK